ncbi:MAG: nucleotidyltransferase domain-containing protein [Candidatus Woesearchaeota archaeon]
MDQEKIFSKMKKELSTKIKVSKIYLFGSRATGSATEQSDYDIAIVSTSFEGMTFMDRQAIVRPLLRKALGIKPIDAACYTPEEFAAGREAFLPGIIAREGIASV